MLIGQKSVQQVMEMSAVERFCYWITEREKIRIAKSQGLPPPWTRDEILQSFRFTNVRRMDDKVSVWLYENWYKPYWNHPNMLSAVALARFINKIDSLAFLGFPEFWDNARIALLLREYRDKGNTLFGAAYMVRGNDGQDKVASVVDFYVQEVTNLGLTGIDTDSMEKSVVALEHNCYGMGSFMAGQIVADLRWAVAGTWTDKHTWAAMGPGSQKGMNCLHNRPFEYHLKQQQFMNELTKLKAECLSKLPISITGKLEMIDYQNCCCEFFKFSKTLLGLGRPKQRYNGKSV